MFLNVILAIDERLEDVKRCVKSLRAVYGPSVPIALVTYGGVAIGKQPAIEEYARIQGFQYVDIGRHKFLTLEDSAEWHACEVLARLQITKHFADLGYDEIYIMHADVTVEKDFRGIFAEKAVGQWSFIAFLIRAVESFDILCQKGSWKLYFEGNRSRLADIIVRYNPSFVARVYAEYKDPAGIWENWLSKFTLWGDLAQFDVARKWNGFTGRYIPAKSDIAPLGGGSIIHSPREKIPDCLGKETHVGLDREGVRRNYERRVE